LGFEVLHDFHDAATDLRVIDTAGF